MCGFWYWFGGRIIQRKETPLCVFRYIAFGNVRIHCIRICLFPLSIKASLCPTQALHFSFSHFLSLFLPYLIGFPSSPSFSLMHFCSHEFFFLVAFFFYAILQPFFSVEHTRFHLPGFFELCPCLKSSAFQVAFCLIACFTRFSSWVWLLCLWLFSEVAFNFYFLFWLVKGYYLGFKWWILWIFVFIGGSDGRWEEIQSFFVR